jgi:2-polyprenyl-3-methyl-5-hydroxy-6-metoxy-1,4-benzoquinol methylase
MNANVRIPPIVSTEKSPASCLACDGELIVDRQDIFDTRFGIAGSYAVAECQQCGLAQITPTPTLPQLKNLYETHYNFVGHSTKRYSGLREKILKSSLYRIWVAIDGDISFQTQRGHGRLLDVGCNEGRNLEIYRSNGYDAEGLELNETAAAIAREKGFSVHTQTVENFEPSDLYDVAVLSNVLEHSIDPLEMVRHIQRVLKPSGLLWISCPNIKSDFKKKFGRYWINWHAPFHITHFSSPILRRLLDKAGFRVQSVRNETPALWFAQSVIAALYAKPGVPTSKLRSPLLVVGLMIFFRGLLFPWSFAMNWLDRGDCLVLVAQKI